MNVMVVNKYKELLMGLNIEVMKSMEGVFNVDEIIDTFTNFYYDKMILDITAIRDYQNTDNLQKLAMNINMENVIGHADLENRGDGVYAYCSLNDSEYGQLAKKLIMHGDITSLSIFANKLTQMGSNVVHGIIRELSLVHAGANDGATIDYVMAHGDEDGEGFIYSSNLALTLYHSDNMSESSEENDGSKDEPAKKDSKEETVEDVINSMTDRQREVMYSMIDYLAGDSESEDPKESDDKKDNKDKGENEMKHDVFDDDGQT